MPARIVAFAGIDPDRAFQLEIAERAPAGIGRQIVGVEGDQRVGRIMVDAAKRAVVVALEHHHLVRPDAPIGHLLAKTFRHGAEIFADHHAAMLHAFLRGRRQQRLERHLHIDAVVGGKAVRHQIEPLQAQHMIEPDRAGMAHRGPQHLAIRLERLQFETGGVEAGEAPVLAGGVERVRRRADGQDGAKSPIARSRHRTRRIARRRRRRDRARPSCRAGPRAPCRPPTAGRRSIARIRRIRFRRHPGPRRRAAHLASSGCRHSSGHSHHGLLRICAAAPRNRRTATAAARARREILEVRWRSSWDRP